MTDLVKKEANALALNQSWGNQAVEATDILIPSLYLMQPMSEFVTEGKAQPGDIVRSTNREVVAKRGESIELVPLVMMRCWHNEEKEGNKFASRGSEPRTAANEDLPLEYRHNGTEWRRNKTLDFYMLSPKDIAKERKALEAIKSGEFPDPDDALLPLFVRFKRTSMNAGKELATFFAKAAHFNLPPAVNSFKLSSEMVKGDQGSYYVFKIEKSGKTSLEDLEVCKRWFNTITSSKVKVHEPEVATEVVDVKPASSPDDKF